MSEISTVSVTTVAVPKMVTISEASEITGLSYGCIRQLCDAHKIPHIRSGVKIMVNMPKLAEYMNVCGVEEKQTDLVS